MQIMDKTFIYIFFHFPELYYDKSTEKEVRERERERREGGRERDNDEVRRRKERTQRVGIDGETDKTVE